MFGSKTFLFFTSISSLHRLFLNYFFFLGFVFFSLLGYLKKSISIPLVLSRNQYDLEMLFTSFSAAIYVIVPQHSFKEKAQLKKH